MDHTLSKVALIACVAALANCSPGRDDAASSAPALAADAPPLESPVDKPEVEITDYDDTWFIGDFWAGEYPPGFTVTGGEVSVMGRAEMKLAAPRVIACPLTKGANYTPWNVTRSQADELIFVSANQMSDITITQDISVETYDGDNLVTLDLKAGDTLQYKHYMAEGFFVGIKDGKEYELQEMDMTDSATFDRRARSDEWVNVKCNNADGTRAWLLVTDMLMESGVQSTEYFDYGTAQDVVAK